MERVDSFLNILNGVQLKAATHPYASALQILAGPGSGKTRVLTSRIAHLILNCNMPAQAICAVTFTNKAANEMRERLTKLLGKDRTSQLKMGTFHSLCARFLRKYAKLVDIPENFTVCDAAESKKIIATLLKRFEKDIKDRSLSLEPGTVASMISKAKSKGKSAEYCLADAKSSLPTQGSSEGAPLSLEVIVAEVYVDYEATLKKNNALDFDDLLVYGVKLFSKHSSVAYWCQHILVDEFQDTNVTQYDLMCAIARTTRSVTIVGDPDQSIYGWRAAEVENLAKMRRDFPNTTQIFLEENYRSTGAILEASLAIVSQDEKRISKSLYTAHPDGISPILYQVSREQEEATFIAVEIKRLIAYMGGVFRWGDFAILLRYNALSRTIENALQREGIPCRILGGHRFFERLEVKDVLAYLQLVDNPTFEPAFLRVINVPGRGIGEKTLSEILQRAEKAQKSPLELLEGIHDTRIPDSKPSIRKKISSFIQVMKKLRLSAQNGMAPSDLIHQLLDIIQYQDHLRRTQQDWETRWENVKELITFAKEVEEQNSRDSALHSEQEDLALDDNVSPLRQFLQTSMLSSAGDNDTEDSLDKVTISTCHSAKGLEWPVVMVPSVDSSTFPFIRSEDEDEERRLLYVACTRAKSLLYITRSTIRTVAGDQKARALSKFIGNVMEKREKEKKMPLFIQHLPQIELEERAIICKVLERPEPDESEVDCLVESFIRLGREYPPLIPWMGPDAYATNFQAYTSYQSSSHLGPFASSSTLSPAAPFTSFASFGRPLAPQIQAPTQGFASLGRGAPTTTFRLPISTTPQAHSSFLTRQPEQGRDNPPASFHTPASSFKSTPPASAPTSSASTSQSVSRASISEQATPFKSTVLISAPASKPVPRGPVSMKAAPFSRPEQPSSVNPSNRQISAPIIENNGHSQQFNAGKSRSTVLQPSGNASTPSSKPVTIANPSTKPQLPQQNTAPPGIVAGVTPATGPPQGVKRRLGMGPRATPGGYANKKFKPPTL
ncbi:hypothetical protein H1R20_g10172, partial [Candolleomyces eurysporus]